MIPRVIHRIWLGDAPMPAEYVAYGEAWERLNRDFEVLLWDDRTVPNWLRCQREFEKSEVPAMRADILRLELLFRFGGIYVDTDVEPLRGFSPLLQHHAFIGREDDFYLCNAVIGAEPGHPTIDHLLTELPFSVMRHAERPVTEQTGPMFITRATDEASWVILPPVAFYPYHHTQKHLRGGPFPKSYAVHHWAMSWG